jgi:threonine dehydrogenase-like Zn-dependent dehydrogenase
MSVPANLTAPVPDHVDPQEAAFAGLGAIAIHALRVADLRFGESAVIVGLGILGNLLAQIASAAAFVPIALDLNPERSERLRQCGIKHAYSSQEELEQQLSLITHGAGADSVLLCASGDGEKLINNSFTWLRDRGKIVIVGDISAQFSRGAMFGKEAQVMISRAGGPGRYDPQYELHNQDYPIGYVRWTEGRNTREYIRLLADKRISVKSLISGIYPVENAKEAFDPYLLNPSPAIGTLLRF